MKSQFANILNRLAQMQLSPYYATAKDDLAMAENTIWQLEAGLNELQEKMLAWKSEAENQYQQVRFFRFGDVDYLAEGALDAVINKRLKEANLEVVK